MSGRRRPPPGPNALTDRQRLFVEEYLVDLNLAAAARRAGYAPSTAHSPDGLLSPAVHAAIDGALAARAERTRVTADRV
ncbi:MAG: BcepC6B, partial [Caulobacteraceae bacterium]|nr:BcepC6B [Caulobacteraceae bacterium]